MLQHNDSRIRPDVMLKHNLQSSVDGPHGGIRKRQNARALTALDAPGDGIIPADTRTCVRGAIPTPAGTQSRGDGIPNPWSLKKRDPAGVASGRVMACLIW